MQRMKSVNFVLKKLDYTKTCPINLNYVISMYLRYKTVYSIFGDY